MNQIKKAWRGQERLWKVFWIYNVLVGIVINLVASFLESADVVIHGVWLLFSLVYTVWILVSEWRCAFNVDWKFWGYVIRVLIVSIPVLLVLGFVVGGVLVGKDLIVAAECRKELTDYAVQNGLDPREYVSEEKRNECYRQKNASQMMTSEPREQKAP